MKITKLKPATLLTALVTSLGFFSGTASAENLTVALATEPKIFQNNELIGFSSEPVSDSSGTNFRIKYRLRAVFQKFSIFRR